MSQEKSMNWQQDYERKQITLDQVFEQHLTGRNSTGQNQKIYMVGLHVPTTLIN